MPTIPTPLFPRRPLTWLLIIGGLLYLDAFLGGYHFDDAVIFQDAAYYWQGPIAAAKNFFSLSDNRQFGYRQFGTLSFVLEDALWGKSPFLDHLINLAIHLLSGLLLYLLLLRLFPHLKLPVGQERLLAFAAASLFLAHPVNTAAVTYIIKRYNSLSTLCCLASFYFYLIYRERKYWRPALVSVLSALAAFATHPGTLAFPFLILLYEFTVRRSLPARWGKNWNRNAFFTGALALGIFVVAALLLPTLYRQEFLFRPRALLHYITLFLLPWPGRLNIFPEFTVSTGWFFPFSTFPAAALTAVLLTATLIAWRSYPLVGWGLSWFFSALAVEFLAFMFTPLRPLGEHALYMAGIGLIIAASAFCRRLLKSPRRFMVLWLILLVLFSAATIRRNFTYRSEIALWSDTLKKSPHALLPRYALAGAYLRKMDYIKAVHLTGSAPPPASQPYYRILYCLFWSQYYFNFEDYQASHRLLSAIPAAFQTLDFVKGTVYYAQAETLWGMGKNREALSLLTQAYDMNPLDPAVHLLKLKILRNLDVQLALDKAAMLFKVYGRRLDYGEHLDIWYQMALANVDYNPEATLQYCREIKSRCDFYPPAEDLQGRVLTALSSSNDNKDAQAERHWSLLIAEQPDFPWAAKELGRVLWDLGRPAEAAEWTALAEKTASCAELRPTQIHNYAAPDTLYTLFYDLFGSISSGSDGSRYRWPILQATAANLAAQNMPYPARIIYTRLLQEMPTYPGIYSALAKIAAREGARELKALYLFKELSKAGWWGRVHRQQANVYSNLGRLELKARHRQAAELLGQVQRLLLERPYYRLLIQEPKIDE